MIMGNRLTDIIDEDEFNEVMEKHPEFLQKLMGITHLSEEEARARIGKWFYSSNGMLNNEKPITIYRNDGPESLYRFFEKPDWSKILP